jgi:hypothetical protein
MAPAGGLVRAQRILYLLCFVIFFALFINYYRVPKVIRGNVIFSAAYKAKYIDTPTVKLSHRSSANLAPLLQISGLLTCKNPGLWGREHGGGWVVCLDDEVFSGKDLVSNSTKDTCVVYSFGLGADWSFDMAAEHRGCEVHSILLLSDLFYEQHLQFIFLILNE